MSFQNRYFLRKRNIMSFLVQSLIKHLMCHAIFLQIHSRKMSYVNDSYMSTVKPPYRFVEGAGAGRPNFDKI